jgi:hypothetical protein
VSSSPVLWLRVLYSEERMTGLPLRGGTPRVLRATSGVFGLRIRWNGMEWFLELILMFG